ncbi:MAG TPA: HAMP domain-containing sensor histidine kinase [Nitrososphaeraceae archaeon]|nr:HAMP domain-containing sensor histidine kinase [Nitrososphaeraceae archaeon]
MPPRNNNYNSTIINSDSYDTSENETTKIFHGTENSTKALVEFVSKAKQRIDSVVDSTAPSIIIETESIRKERFSAAKDRGVKFRYVTEITKDNISYCKEMLKFASEIRHLDGIKGNFEVSDEREYVGSANFQNSKPLPQLIYSNVKEIVEQQQFIFESFWNRAMPSEQKIREIEYGIVPEVTEVIQSPEDAEKLEWNLLRKAKKEVNIIYSTANAFYIQDNTGTIEFLNQLAEEGISIKLLTPTDNYIIKTLQNLNQHQHHNQNQQQHNNKIIDFRNIAPTLGIKFKSLIIDRKYSLIMELKDDLKQNISTAEALGWSTYSNSQATVLSYLSIFETLWRQTELNEQLQQSDRIKTEFINLAAHELRTPIMPIIGYAEMLEEELGEEDKKRESTAAIIRNAKRLQRLAESILDVTRIETNTLKVHKEQHNLNDLILNVLDDIVINTKEEELRGGHADNNRCKLLYKACEEEIIIQADKTRLIQVIYNLLHNAIKFTKEGTISILVEKKKDDENNNNNNKYSNKKEVIISVKDTGSGIDSEIFPRLFSKFASKSSQGTGLGLFISKSIIEDHGGKIWAENNADGKGATFSFSLPTTNE